MRVAPFWCASDGGSHDSVSDVELTERTAGFRGGPSGAKDKEEKHHKKAPIFILLRLCFIFNTASVYLQQVCAIAATDDTCCKKARNKSTKNVPESSRDSNQRHSEYQSDTLTTESLGPLAFTTIDTTKFPREWLLNCTGKLITFLFQQHCLSYSIRSNCECTAILLNVYYMYIVPSVVLYVAIESI